jgi:large subunit ribosomal protein L21
VFAIVEVGSRQYKVNVGDTLLIPRIKSKKEVSLDKVLMFSSGKDIEIGEPYVKGAKVICDIIGDKKGEKLIAFKYRRRETYKKKKGHRDLLTEVKVKEIKMA